MHLSHLTSLLSTHPRQSQNKTVLPCALIVANCELNDRAFTCTLNHNHWLFSRSLWDVLTNSWCKTLALVGWCVCVGGNSATAVVFLTLPPPPSPGSPAMGFTQQAPCNLLHREKYQTDWWKQELSRRRSFRNPKVALVYVSVRYIEPLLLHNTTHRQLVVAGQTTPIRTDAGWWFQCHTDTAAAWDYNSSNTTANSRPR